MTLTDAGEPGKNDSIGFTLWNGESAGVLEPLAGASTAEQPLYPGNGNGNLQIR